MQPTSAVDNCADGDFGKCIIIIDCFEIFIERPTSLMADDLNSLQELWCYCQQNKDEMVGCDNGDCPIQWFHMSCWNLTADELPSGDWFCPECS